MMRIRTRSIRFSPRASLSRPAVVSYETSVADANGMNGAPQHGQDYLRAAYAYDPYAAYGGMMAYGQQTPWRRT